MKFLILLFLTLMLPVVTAVTFGNQTQVYEGTNGSHIRFEQDTNMEELRLNTTLGKIIMDNVSNFNLTFTSLKPTDYSVVLFLDILNKTGEYGNGSSFVTTTLDNFEILIEGNDTFTWLDFVPAVIIAATPSIFIYPDVNQTVMHIILGRRIIFR